MTTKPCIKCLQEKPLTEFYKHSKMADGHLNKCKECTKSDVKKHRSENLERIREYDRSRGRFPHRVAARAAYQLTDAYRKIHAESTKKWKAHHPDRRRAANILNSAIRDKKVFAWPVCAVPACCTESPQAHHADYSRPLDVVWLCAKHHAQAHKMARELLRQSEKHAHPARPARAFLRP